MICCECVQRFNFTLPIIHGFYKFLDNTYINYDIISQFQQDTDQINWLYLERT